MKYTYKSNSPEETAQLAADLAKQAEPGDIVCLCGDLGAGKTVFARGFALGLGYAHEVTSPTFTLMNIYEGGRLTLYHFDLYRLEEGAEALEGIGYEDYFYNNGVCLVEWAERGRAVMPPEAMWVTLAGQGDCREITVHENIGH